MVIFLGGIKNKILIERAKSSVAHEEPATKKNPIVGFFVGKGGERLGRWLGIYLKSRLLRVEGRKPRLQCLYHLACYILERISLRFQFPPQYHEAAGGGNCFKEMDPYHVIQAAYKGSGDR